jgi:lipoprotein-anchoring transpeptidase ErfK/SrfK
MCKSIWAGAVIVAALAVTPARAEKLTFSPMAFQVFGGLGSGHAAPSLSMRKPSHGALMHRTVAFRSSYAPGTVIVRTGTRRLYYVLGSGEAVEYRVGVGREGYEWSGSNRVSAKAEWPDWRPPQEMIEREAKRGHDIPGHMPGGPDNPLGARAIYIGNTQYRIHGTTQPWSIGLAMSSGCIRMMNEEVIDLYNRVKIGALVVVE